MSDELLTALESAWDQNSGFFARLRDGDFDQEGFDRLIRLLDQIDFGDQDHVDHRLVTLLWFMPSFMRTQREWMKLRGVDLFVVELSISRIDNAIERILGTPWPNPPFDSDPEIEIET
jgi:hypothetical protein